MTSTAAALAATVLTCTVAAVGCGVGPGEAADGEASLSITRDYGAEVLTTATLEGPTPSDTVVRFLDANAEIDTEYGGNFVSTIDGLEGSTVDGGPEDWFFFVNGIYSEVGAGEVEVEAGDRVWWDYRSWSEAYRVPAVVGSWPEPFLHGYGGEVRPVVVECVTSDAGPCDAVVQSLRDQGVEPDLEEVEAPVEHPESMRILVGEWERLREDPAAGQLEDGPGTSGVYAQVRRCGAATTLEILGSDAQPRQQLDGAALVAALREGDEEPTWVVTATGEELLDEAAGLVEEASLRDRYAVATAEGGEPVAVPAPDDAPVIRPECP